jgi:hypothetical protein
MVADWQPIVEISWEKPYLAKKIGFVALLLQISACNIQHLSFLELGFGGTIEETFVQGH